MTLHSELKQRLETAVADRLDRLTALYRHFHAHPELSEREEGTAARVAAELDRFGVQTLTGIGGYGVAGILENGPGPALLIRADMDALPVTEATELGFASKVRVIGPGGREVGVMHACGHDLHMTCMIGAAAALTELKDLWSGKIIFVAQPAEETVGGARLMMEGGLYEKTGRPDFGIALHVEPDLPSGVVGLGAGVRSAGSHPLDVTIRGRGGHGAMPHKARDPVVLASRFVLALQTIVSRELNPADMGIITVGSIHGGSKRNIIPDRVDLDLTIRFYKPEVGKHIIKAVKRTAEGLAGAAGLPPDLNPIVKTPEPPFPPVVNDPGLTRRLTRAFADLLGADNVTETPPSTGSEDFGFFGLTEPAVPLVYYKLGVTDQKRLDAARNGEGAVSMLHETGFYPDLERGLPTGVTTLAWAGLSLLSP